MSCPKGGEHSLVDDFNGQYCEKCLEPVSGPSKPKARRAASASEDTEITKAIKKMATLLDKRADKLKCLNGRGHTACLDALNLLMLEWKNWKGE